MTDTQGRRSLDDHVLHVGRVSQRPRDEAVVLGLLHERLHVAAGKISFHVDAQLGVAELPVIGLHSDCKLSELDVTLARRMHDGKREAGRQRRQEQLRGRRSRIIAARRRRFIRDDVKVADVDVRPVPALPPSEEDLVSHGR